MSPGLLGTVLALWVLMAAVLVGAWIVTGWCTIPDAAEVRQ